MLKVTVPSSSASSCCSVTASVAQGPGSLVPDYWIHGSNRDALSDFFDVETELGRYITPNSNSPYFRWPAGSPHWKITQATLTQAIKTNSPPIHS